MVIMIETSTYGERDQRRTPYVPSVMWAIYPQRFAIQEIALLAKCVDRTVSTPYMVFV
jgi:hypothetical protein